MCTCRACPSGALKDSGDTHLAAKPLAQSVPTGVDVLLFQSPAAVPHLAHKLPHYGKYSYLLFSGGEAKNMFKGRWQTLASGLSAVLVSFRKLPPLRLADHPPLEATPEAVGQQSQAAR